MTDVAPYCPISRSQLPGGSSMPQTRLPTVPIATDLPSLIRAVNIALDVLRSFTTSLTVNNTSTARIPPPPPTYNVSEYPAWQQDGVGQTLGYVYYKYKDKNGVPQKDKTQRAFILRTDAVNFRNPNSDDAREHFRWSYNKSLDEVLVKATLPSA